MNFKRKQHFAIAGFLLSLPRIKFLCFCLFATFCGHLDKAFVGGVSMLSCLEQLSQMSLPSKFTLMQKSLHPTEK